MSGKFIIKAYVVSDIGKIRTNHEDNFLLNDGQMINDAEQCEISGSGAQKLKYIKKEYCLTNDSNFIFAVADGMGGHNAGEAASHISVDELYRMKNYIFRTNELHEINQRFQEYVVKVNNIISLKGRTNNDMKGMGATLTGVVVCEEGVEAFNIGDSRSYSFIDGKLTQLTRDHTEGQRLLDLDIVSREELHLIESRKAILRYLGIDEKHYVTSADICKPIKIQNRGWFLLCSDGLTDVVSEKMINTILGDYFEKCDIKSAVHELVECALEGNGDIRGGIDNITVLLVEIDNYIPTFREKLFSKLQFRKEMH